MNDASLFISDIEMSTLMSRAVKNKMLSFICRGLYAKERGEEDLKRYVITMSHYQVIISGVVPLRF